MATPPPTLSITVSLSPPTYSYSSPLPPVLSLTIESHAPRPLTLFTYHTPFHPASALTQACFPITDTATNTPIPQTTLRVQNSPVSRARGSGDEIYFLTLHPQTPTVVSTAFSRGGGMRPQPRAVVERGWEVDGKGNERKIRRSTKGCGVDGLESGHCYRVDVARAGLKGVWWWWGTEEEILVEQGSGDWNLNSLEPEQTSLGIGEIEGVEFCVE